MIRSILRSLGEIILSLGFSCALLPNAFGQTITINTLVSHEVYGNGESPGGAAPGGNPSDLTLPASNNSVIVENGGTVAGSTYYGTTSGGSIYGGYDPGGGAANKNTVIIESGGFVDGGTYRSGDVYGGYAHSGDYTADNTANENTVTIDGGTKNDGTTLTVTGGYATGIKGMASGNVVTINGGAVYSVTGGDAGNMANENTVNIDDSSVSEDVIGGWSNDDGSDSIASSNVVAVNQSAVSGSVYGGHASALHGPATITVNANIVTISGASAVSGDVYGGWGQTWVAGPVESLGNKVTVENSASVNGAIYGGWTSNSYDTATATGNSVAISGGAHVGSAVYGGWAANSYGTATAMCNDVTISGGTVDGDVSGGAAMNAYGSNSMATGNSNKVIISGGTVNGGVSGGAVVISYGIADTATATDNKVIISGGTVNGNISGGSITNSYGSADNAMATDNTVTISGSPIFGANTILYGGSINGAGDAFSGNTLNLYSAGLTVAGLHNFQNLNLYLPSDLSGPMLTVTNDATLGNGVTGSTVRAIGLGDNQTVAPGDTVRLIQAGALVLNGFAQSQVQGTDDAGLTTTWKLITDATASDDGSYLDAFLKILATPGDLTRPNGITVHSSATENVSLSVGGALTVGDAGLTVDNSASGGVSVNIGTLDATAHDATVTLTNTIAWDGTNGVLFNTLNLGGDHTFTMAGSGGYTVNTYNVSGPATFNGNLNAAGSTMNFYLPAAMGNGGTMLNVTGNANVTGSRVNVGISGASSPLQAGDAVILINAATLTGAPANTTANATGMQGVTLIYDFNLSTTGNQLVATVAGAPEPGPGPARVNPQAKSLSEGFVSGVSLLNQGIDLTAGTGMSAAVDAARLPIGSSYGLGIFSTSSGGWARYDTGSQVEMSSLSLMAGMSKRVVFNHGNLTVGAFFEYGNGSYDTYNSFNNAASVHGEGDLHHLGGGIIARMDFTGSSEGHCYAEASVRAGSVDTDYKGDLRDPMGLAASYDSSSAYYGLHLATGYVWNLANKSTLDLYGKYFWTHEGGDSLRLSTGNPVDFDDVNSHRLRFGGRLSYNKYETVNPYIGVAYEHEFDGEARATTDGYAITAPSLEGDTGIGELGLTFKPSAALPVSVDLGVQGYVGTREGFTGTLHIRYDF